MGPGGIGIDPDRGAELGDRFLWLPLVVQGEAKFVVGLEVVGIDPDRGPEFGDRRLQVPLRCQNEAEVVVRIREVGIDPDRGAELGDRLFPLPLVSQGVAEVVVGLGEIGPELKRRGEFRNRLLQLLLSGQGDAAVIVNVGVGQLPARPLARAAPSSRRRGCNGLRRCRPAAVPWRRWPRSASPATAHGAPSRARAGNPSDPRSRRPARRTGCSEGRGPPSRRPAARRRSANTSCRRARSWGPPPSRKSRRSGNLFISDTCGFSKGYSRSVGLARPRSCKPSAARLFWPRDCDGSAAGGAPASVRRHRSRLMGSRRVTG